MKKIIAIIGIVIAILAAGVVIFSLTKPPSHYTGPLLPLTIGGPALEASGLIYIAEDRHYFDRNGLNVTGRTYDSGGATIGGLMNNDIDIGMMSEFVMVTHILKGENITSLGCIDKFDNMFLVGRNVSGTATLPGMMGKRIGIPKGTIADFYLGRFLELHRMNLRDMTTVDIRPSNSADSLANGTIDAVVMWHPYLETIPGQKTGDVTVWPIQSGQLTYWNAVCRGDWVSSHQTEVDRFLRSIAEAEQFSQQHPAEAKIIIQKRLGYDDSYMATILPDHQYSLSLDRGMTAAMNDEARWTLENNPNSPVQIPYFPDYLYAKGLSNVKPDSVDIG